MGPISRRGVLAGAGAALLCPAPARAVSGGQRRFLFIYAKGGWDPVWFFAPLFDSPHVDMPTDAQPGLVGNLPFVDSDNRPILREFLEAYGGQTAFVQGIEIPSVAHDGCQRLLCTGSLAEGTDDWPSIIAGHAGGNPLLPLVHLSGPSYTNRYVSSVVRVGSRGQLVELLDGSALTRSDLPVTAPSPSAEAALDAFVRERANLRAETAGRGWEARLKQGAAAAERQFQGVRDAGLAAALAGGDSLQERVDLAIDYLATGQSRVAVVAYVAWDNVFNGWDTHTSIDLQGKHYNELFTVVDAAWTRARAEAGPAGGALADELVVVLLSEMGRYPRLNADGGKDHWTWTSAMLLGSGVRGDQVVGGYDEQCAGQRLDLSTGEVDSGGEALLTSNFGATLLRLADIDPGEFTAGAAPIEALLA